VNKTHANRLTARLEKVVDRGMTHILWSELYRWYEAQRITVNVWRDIAERWEDVADDGNRQDGAKLGGLSSIEGAGGVFLVATNKVEAIVE
jgi:hypothetical protein